MSNETRAPILCLMHWILAVVLFWLQLKLKNWKMEFWWTSHAFLHHRFLHETCGFQWGNSKHGIQNKIWVGKSSYLLDNSDLIISVQNLNYSPVVTIGIWANDLQIESIGAVLDSPASSSLVCEIDTWCRQTDVNWGLELALTFCL